MEPSELLVGLGLLLIVEGVPLFLSPSRYRALLRQMALVSDAVLRVFGLGAMTVGLLLLYALR